MGSRGSNSGFIKVLLLSFYFVLLFRLSNGSITFCSIFCLMVLFSGNNKLLSINTLLLLLYSLSFSLIMSLKNGFNMANLADTVLPPFCFYLFGIKVVDFYLSSQNKILPFLLLTTLFYGAFTYYWSIQDIILTNSIISPIRVLTIGNTTYTATLVGTNVCLGLVGLSAFFVVKNRIIRWGFLLAWVLSILTVVHMVNRSGLVVSILCLLIVLLAYYSGTKRFSTVVVSILFIIGLYIVFSNLLLESESFLSITEAYGERELDDGSAVLVGGGRTVRWVDALQNIPTHPFGWTTSSSGYTYAHNMWLDIAKDAGWIPFLLLIILTIRIIKSIFRLLKKEKSPLTLVLLGLNVCLFSSALVEPIVGGIFFACYCMFWGMQDRYFTVKYA